LKIVDVMANANQLSGGGTGILAIRQTVQRQHHGISVADIRVAVAPNVLDS
jgi:hypothetical protein